MGCFACGQEAMRDLPPREDVLRTEHWRVAHAFATSLPGWLVLLSRTHVLALDELPHAAHVELGGLLGDLSAALREVVGCEKTYVMQFSEAEGYSHLHVHLVPRMPDQADRHRGPGIFALLDVDEAEQVGPAERDSRALALRDALRRGVTARPAPA